MLQPPGHEPPRELGAARPGDSGAAMKPAGWGNWPLSSKKMYVALGGAGGKVTSRDPGEIKTNRLGGVGVGVGGTSERFLRLSRVR